MGKPRILLLYGHAQNLGGVVHFYASLERFYSDSEYSVRHMRTGRIQESNIMSRLPLRVIDYLANLAKFIYLVMSLRPHIIHVNPSLDTKSIYRDCIYILLAKLLLPRVKILTHFRGWRDEIALNLGSTTFLSRVTRFMLRHSDHVIVLARKFKLILSRYFPLERISVVYTTVDVDNFSYRYNRPAPSPACRRLLFLSRITKEKGVFEIAESLSTLAGAGELNGVNTILAGDGPVRKEIEERLRSSELLGEYVSMPGYLRNGEKMSAYTSADIFLFPSYHEGCPVAVLEAMASGLALIATDVGAISEIVSDGENGIIIPPRDSKELTEAIRLLLANPSLVKKFSRNNLKKVRDIADTAVIFAKISQVYKQLLASASSRSAHAPYPGNSNGQ